MWSDMESIDEWTRKGYSQYEQRNFHEAIECYNKSLAINSKNTRTLLLKGNALQGLKKFDEAIKCYDQTLQIVPESVDLLIVTLQCKRTCFAELDKYDEAYECNERILAINPNFEDALEHKEYYNEYFFDSDDDEPLGYE